MNLDNGNGQAFNPIISLLVREGFLSEQQADYARRVASRLHMAKPLSEVVLELGYVTDEQMRQTIRRNQGELRIGDLLGGLGYLTDEELDRALALQAQEGRQQKLGDILIQHKFLADDKLTEILALQLGLPVLELTAKEPDPGLLGRGPVEYYEQYRFVPYDMQTDGSIRIAFVDPLDPRSLDAARDYFGKNIVVCITRVSQLDEILAKRKEELRLGAASDQGRLNVVEIANTIVLAAFKRGASDIHVEPMSDRLRVRFRVDGVMVNFRDYPIGVVASLVSRFKIMCGADIAEKRRHQDGRLIFNHMGVQIDLRMSFYVTVYGEQIVMRLLKSQEELLPMHELGMLPGMLNRFMEEALDAPSGVIMVTGPTGSGKSTTVYSCINYLNRPDVSIITAEDPVEYKVRGIGQCSIMPSIGLTFEETLKHIVRQDPDIVVIGEVRDHFSAVMCIQTALTGHKVLTTFHTEDSIGALVRLLDMDIEPFLVSSTLSCVLAQRLVRKVCPHCAVPYQPDLSQLRRIGCTYGDLAGAEFRKGRGCAACRHSGYKGRLAVYEMLIPEVFIRDAVLQRRTTHELREISLEKAGLVSLLEDGITKAALGITTVDEILRTLPRVHKPRPLVELRRILGA
ncbi:GspE/PulE family protein [Desulfomicrobium escambiense]|uniref:GspE/PulE family protein n=1 Tax=Desulfomicrobium escambiense TaxID=29503 RepID=UPI00042A8C08|nr:GspE/PulE family protein [Desulfomicrobium escambiense]